MYEIIYEFANSKDENKIKEVLRKCQLPTDGIAPHLEDFILAKANNGLIGVIGLETLGSVGLLRSLAVVPEARGKGIGKDLFLRLNAHAYRKKLNDLYLLTTTAEVFFYELGFKKISRNHVPAALRASVEFQTLCPESATCMVKQFDGKAIYFPREVLSLKPDVPGAMMWGVALDKTLLTYFEVEPNSRFDRHNHVSEQITTVLNGELFFELDNGTFSVKQGEVIAIPSNVPHAVFTRESPVKAIDAWSPVIQQYGGPNPSTDCVKTIE